MTAPPTPCSTPPPGRQERNPPDPHPRRSAASSHIFRPWWQLLALAAGALAAGGCGKASPQEIATTDKVPVVTRPAVRGSIRAVVTATGTVRPALGAELVVTAPQPGRIAEMLSAVGTRVRKGDLLVRFDIPTLRSDATEKSAEVTRAEARLANSRAAEQRIRGLFERGIAARKELEDAQREATDAQAALRGAQSARSAAGALAGRTVVRAPFSGVVTSRTHNPGDFVDNTTELLRLVDPDRLQVEAAVPLAQVGLIAPGNPARVTGPSSFPPEEGTVLTRPAAVDAATATATVALAFARPTRLPAGTPVRVEIFGEEHAGAVVVPAAAVVQEGSESYLFTVDAKGIAHRRKVGIGIVAGDSAEVVAGLRPGEPVVIEGQNALPDGAATIPATPAPASEPAPGEAGAP
jgi:RND family efflux transporter MFP subunit